MKKWTPRTKRAKKLWDRRVKEFESEPEFHELYQEWYWTYRGGLEDYYFDEEDPRQIVYMTDGLYITKDGIVLGEEDAEILDF